VCESERVDTELVAYLGRQFDAFGAQLGGAIRAGDEETRRALGEEIRSVAEELGRVLREEIRAGDEETRRVLRDEIHTGDEESRRHMGVLTKSLMSPIQLVAEGVVALGERVDRLQTDIRGEFGRIDRRLLHLTAKISSPRRRS
jgi:hypothetical protein